MIRPIVLQRTGRETEEDPPPKREITVYVGLTDAQVTCYQNILRTVVT